MPEAPLSPRLLEERAIFTFHTEALHEISTAIAALEQHLGPRTQLLQELTCLTAAEFALLPILIDPRSMIPITEPTPVDAAYARLALAKTNCLYITWLCGRTSSRPQLSLVDITAFSGDVAKLEAIGFRSVPEPGVNEMARAVRTIEDAHRAAPAELAQRLGGSGVLRVQGFLWAVKYALPTDPRLELVMNASYTAFGLDQPLGESAPAFV